MKPAVELTRRGGRFFGLIDYVSVLSFFGHAAVRKRCTIGIQWRIAGVHQ
jgi:hypothetical protein